MDVLDLHIWSHMVSWYSMVHQVKKNLIPELLHWRMRDVKMIRYYIITHKAKIKNKCVSLRQSKNWNKNVFFVVQTLKWNFNVICQYFKCKAYVCKFQSSYVGPIGIDCYSNTKTNFREIY